MKVRGKTATVRGGKSVLELRITGPGRFGLEKRELASKSAARKVAEMTLYRLFVRLPRGREICFRMEGKCLPRRRRKP